MQTLQLINMTPSDLAEIVVRKLSDKATLGSDEGTTLAKYVPFVTRQQAADILRCSTAYIATLIDQGDLQEHDRKSSARIKTVQVWKCLQEGKTGNKKPPVKFEKIK